MRHALTLHPDSRCPAITYIEVEAARPGPGKLALRYFMAGAISKLRLPPAAAPARADELWRRTCFEAFVRAPPSAGYYELNFAPSMQWAAYRFSGYREGMQVASELRAPHIEAQANAERLELQVSLDLPSLSKDEVWRLGLSAVIEETSGRRSYWALAHPPGKPDFHHSAGFAYELRAAERI